MEMRNADIYFTLDGSDVSVKSNLYLEPISINDSKILKAISVKNGLISKQIQAEFTKPPKGRSIKLLSIWIAIFCRWNQRL